MLNEWISVHDELPMEYDYVLISYVDNDNPRLRYVPSVGVYRNGSWSTRESSATQMTKSWDFEREFKVTITHWMPLPSAPK